MEEKKICLVCGNSRWVNGPGDNYLVPCDTCNKDGKLTGDLDFYTTYERTNS